MSTEEPTVSIRNVSGKLVELRCSADLVFEIKIKLPDGSLTVVEGVTYDEFRSNISL